MAATIASINPFPRDVRNAFQDYIQDPQYNNRKHIPYPKWRRIYIFLDDPSIKPENPADSNLKHRALTEFELVNNKLYRQIDTKYLIQQLVVPENNAFNTIINEHLLLLYAGRDKVWAAIQQKYYGISR